MVVDGYTLLSRVFSFVSQGSEEGGGSWRRQPQQQSQQSFANGSPLSSPFPPSPCPKTMLAFSGAAAHSSARIVPHPRPLHFNLPFTHINGTSLTFDPDDELYDDEDDEFEFVEDLEDGFFKKGRRKKPPSRNQPPLKLAVPASKKPLKLSTSKADSNRPMTVVSKKLETRIRKPKDQESYNPSMSSIDDYDFRPNRLSRLSGSRWEEHAYEYIRRKKLRESLGSDQIPNLEPEEEKSVTTTQLSFLGVKDNSNLKMLAELELERKCQPVVEYLISLGLEEAHLRKIARRRKACFYVKFCKVKERVEYLISVGVKDEDVRKIISRHPQILEYTIERMMKPRIQFLQSIGVPETRLGKVITVSPSLLECSLEGSLKRRVKFLVEEVGVHEDDVWKIVLLSPQVLTQSIEGSLRPRLNFLMKKLGISHERVAKMITKHPQLLHYSIKNGIQPRIEFLRSIGMSDPDIAKVLSRSSQVLSLSVEKSLKPKCDYLTKELRCGLRTLTSFPAYLSLSLEKRIRPRHKFLESRNRLPKGPFPMHLLAITDEEFCERWAKSTVEEYHSFRQSLLLSIFAKQFEKRHRWHYDQ